jgi:IS605 OrfB family transposase
VRFSGPLKEACGGYWHRPRCLSTGNALDRRGYRRPEAHKAALKRLRRANKALSRKRRGSANFRKAKARLGRLHARVANIRRDATHKRTTRLAKTYRAIGIEDLNVRGMAKGDIARSIMDGGFHEFRRQLDYKPRWYGSRIVVSRTDGFLRARRFRRERGGLALPRPSGQNSLGWRRT